MDVVDLYDFVRLITGNHRGKKMEAKSSLPPPHESKPEGSPLTGSSTTLPLSAHMAANEDHDVEKTVTERPEEGGQPAARVMTALDWTGPDDPENPENWSTGKKAYHIAYVGLQCFVV